MQLTEFFRLVEKVRQLQKRGERGLVLVESEAELDARLNEGRQSGYDAIPHIRIGWQPDGHLGAALLLPGRVTCVLESLPHPAGMYSAQSVQALCEKWARYSERYGYFFSWDDRSIRLVMSEGARFWSLTGGAG